MLLTFDEEVTDFGYMVYDDPDGGDFYYCDIQAWTSLWNKWFSQGKGTLSATVTTRNTKPIIAVYVPNDGSENVCIAKYDPNAENRIEKNVDYESTIVLPRLALGYYLILAVAVLVVFGIVWLLTRKKAEVHVWIERIGCIRLPTSSVIVSYLVSTGLLIHYLAISPLSFLYLSCCIAAYCWRITFGD